MKKYIFILISVICFHIAKANTDITRVHLYNPAANATTDIEKAVAEAKQTHKNVFIQLGGNWCPWCLEFNRVVTTDKKLDSMLHTNYVVYHLNYSNENKNATILEKLKFPNRFGFPCFIILDENGDELHIQNSAYLEKDKSYNKEKIMEFFGNWTPKALNPNTYKRLLSQ